MDVGYVLRRAGQIAWRHRALWLFGFVVSLGPVGARVGVQGSRWERGARAVVQRLQRSLSGPLPPSLLTGVAVALLLLALASVVGLVLLGILGRAALVDQVQAAEDRGAVDLRSGWQAGRRCLWPVLLIRLLLGLPAAVVMVAGLLPLAATLALISGNGHSQVVVPGVLALPVLTLVCLFPALGFAALLSLALDVMRRLAVRACVLESCGVGGSVTRAWSMLRAHVGAVLLLWLVLLLLGVGVSILAVVPLAVMMMVLVMAALAAALVSPSLLVALAAAAVMLAWLTGSAAYGVAETFFSAAWTLAYREMAELGRTGEGETHPGSFLRC